MKEGNLKMETLRTGRFKKTVSFIALFLILAMVLGSLAGALTGCGAQSGSGQKTKVRIAALKGPTTIGLVHLIDKAERGEAKGDYEFTMYTQGSDVMAAMAAGETDIGLVPSNVACVMNKKVEGGVTVIDINTLGVLNCVTGNAEIASIADLSGKTVYMTGQGATPEYTMRYLLDMNGVTDCNIEFKSEPTEVVALLSENYDAVGILPQPFATAALLQDRAFNIAFSLDDEWAKVNDSCNIITGVTVVSNKFLENNKDAVDTFLSEHKDSVDLALSNVDDTARLVVEQGIIAKEPLAKKAIPNCNIVCITGKEMRESLGGYLQVIFDMDPKTLGGSLPEDGFYYEK
ncbi:MAG: ABC transporter substrate-binding protein [Butyrivibrio sp.]|nr:ABC transporter substrate-binding protein [Butyrivibrio sp.]